MVAQLGIPHHRQNTLTQPSDPSFKQPQNPLDTLTYRCTHTTFPNLLFNMLIMGQSQKTCYRNVLINLFPMDTDPTPN